MEKYGTIPPRFTKAWWGHYLYYYKFHAAAVAFVVFMFGSIIWSNVTRTHYDLHLSYVGVANITDEKEAVLSEYFLPEIEEVTGNDKKEVEYIYYGFESADQGEMVSEYEYAYQMKLVAEMQAGESDLYLFTGTNAKDLEGFGEGFMEADELAGKQCPEDKIIRNEEGRAFAVSIAGNEMLESLGIDTSDLYVAVRLLYDKNKENENQINIHKNSIKAARLLIGDRI